MIGRGSARSFVGLGVKSLLLTITGIRIGEEVEKDVMARYCVPCITLPLQAGRKKNGERPGCLSRKRCPHSQEKGVLVFINDPRCARYKISL
jgi:hypothetical protein